MRQKPSRARPENLPVTDRAHGNATSVPSPGEFAEGTPLLISKLAVPALPDGLVDRPRLGKLLDSGIGGPVTLLSAPAGYGKTVLLSAWVRTGSPACSVGWLTLEPDDVGDRFWAYVHAALSSSEACGKDGRSVLPSPGDRRDGVYLTRLAGTLAGMPEPVVLVLDDFDRVADPRVTEGLQFLVRHAAARLRLVIATRVDPALPLPRWRLSGELTELRADELAFRPSEAAELLNHHDLLISDADLRELHARAEGWAAGLRLAALSMRGHPEPARFVAEFGGDDRGVVDYLAGEVFERQSPALRDVLLCTSVLQRVCGPLVDALMGRKDGERVLTDLERANAFVVPLGDQRTWYRYHRLFGDALRAELRRQRPEWIPDLHRRAASWHAANGLPAEALRHALAARDWCLAKGLAKGQWPQVALGAQDETPLAPMRTPPPPAALGADADLALACAADRLNARDLEAAGSYLHLAAGSGNLLSEERKGRFAVMLAAFRLIEAQLGGDVARILGSAERLLGQVERTDADGDLEEVEREGARAIALSALGAERLTLGDLDPAEEALGRGLAAAERAGLFCPRLACAGRIAVLRAFRGQLGLAERTARVALGMPPCEGRCHHTHSAHAYLAEAIVHYQRGDLQASERHLDLAAHLCEPVSEQPLQAMIAIFRTGLLQAQGRLTEGYEVLLAGRRRLTGRQSSRYLRHWFAAAEADLRTSYGDTVTARELLREAPGESTVLALALARTYLRDHDPHAALRALPRWAGQESAEPYLVSRLEAGFLEALAVHSAGDARRASGLLERVLELAEPEGVKRVFTQGGQEGRDLLAEHLDTGTAFWSTVSELLRGTDDRPPEAGPDHHAAGRPLTDRELTVLRYLQSMLSNVEIASELSLSVNTVKTHVRNIYRKLDADRRREAVRRARELQLL
ncbi:MAG TPA: LuxR C-terminal-related transcriptional regulator [Actinomadura sp.]|jgi:LuxR family maltose regulon positive regulatory protein|nr:LuxR C-terminal-related transcriptional regulator [Actinomadura sp.]